ncbi:MAG: hypothetical protein AABY22_07650 [Nanoarchaeota archaeon]
MKKIIVPIFMDTVEKISKSKDPMILEERMILFTLDDIYAFNKKCNFMYVTISQIKLVLDFVQTVQPRYNINFEYFLEKYLEIVNL